LASFRRQERHHALLFVMSVDGSRDRGRLVLIGIIYFLLRSGT
jgi:hypothetical protein